ncbi:LexA family transcriptional regulator [Deinococcus sp. KSM4-11]|uniref:LexA family protein n=1 Tax=Deinococcus sp. KSM4-11 TaxID=2568654 RepID=UPI0010A551CA|nr:S24 family peptidase [Deinococcus sp. KSM4-11]THF85492.1 LexA family transcriptional regulator [Deinococcus sp. KSM4-11]
MPPDLTPTRKTILSAVLRLGTDASATRVAHTAGLSKQALTYQAQRLRELGYLAPSAGRYGVLVPTDRTRALLGPGGYPLVGDIAAGIPDLAEQEDGQYVTRLDEVIDMREGDYLLRVRGESMTGIGVFPGDLVIVRPCDRLQNGEVGVVLIPGEGVATLKRFFLNGKAVTLRSENPEYPEMVFPSADVRIQGQLVAHIGQSIARPRRS